MAMFPGLCLTISLIMRQWILTSLVRFEKSFNFRIADVCGICSKSWHKMKKYSLFTKTFETLMK